MTRALIFALLLTSCGGASYVVESDQPLFTLVNLRADHRGNVSSINYADQTLVAVCTPVQIQQIRGGQIRFVANGRRFRFIRHRSSRTPIEQHVQRLFGTSCTDMSQVTPEDQAGIQQGQVFQGMTKTGVVIAMGYPPEHRTPTLDGDVWTYWRRRGGQFRIQFAQGRVVGLTGAGQPVVQQGVQPVVQVQPTTPQPYVQPQAQPGATVTVTVDANGYPVAQ